MKIDDEQWGEIKNGLPCLQSNGRNVWVIRIDAIMSVSKVELIYHLKFDENFRVVDIVDNDSVLVSNTNLSLEEAWPGKTWEEIESLVWSPMCNFTPFIQSASFVDSPVFFIHRNEKDELTISAFDSDILKFDGWREMDGHLLNSRLSVDEISDYLEVMR